MQTEGKNPGALKPWLIALAVPFFMGAAGGAYHGYHYQWKDIHVRHPGSFQYMTEADTERSCWESAGVEALFFGVPAGLLGLGVFGFFRFFSKFAKRGVVGNDPKP